MAKYRKQPVVVDAHQLPRIGQTTPDLFIDWANKVGFDEWHYDSSTGKMTIPTLEGPLTASPGDWIVRGIEGEFYSCKPSIFVKSYEFVED